MSPIQQMLLGAGAVATKTYVDNIFNTQVYAGNGTSSNTQTTGIDMTEDFLLWTKRRSATEAHYLFDSKRTSGSNYISAFTNSSANGNSRNWITPTSTGYQINDNDQAINASGSTYVSFSFKPTKGFFTCLTYVGNGTAGRQISHDLKSKPGLILIKRTDGAAKWIVYHRDTGASKSANLNNTNAFETDTYSFNQTEPTSTHFSVGSLYTNVNNEDYVAYIFAGGEDQTTATARSVDFDGSGDVLSIPDSSDFNIDGTNFTLECWFKADDLSGNQAIAGQWELAGGTDRNFDFYLVGSTLYFENCRGSTNYSVTTTVEVGQWYHIAGVLDGTTLKLFVNGNLAGTTTVSGSANNSTANFGIGGYATGTADEFHGKISNLRFVKGTAVYTSSFRPPTEPLTNITNTKLLCCNNSSTTGSTVTPGTITANGDPTASTDSPFDDPAGFVFGDAGDQNVISTGSYIGTGSAGIEVNIGWEPQWIMVKSATSAENWEIYDTMRGLAVGGDAERLKVNTNDAEDTNSNWFALTANGFIVNSTSGSANSSGQTYIFLAIRRPDGYVGKPYGAGEGTDVFAMDTGNGSTTIPAFDSGFIVDMVLNRKYASTWAWQLGTRLQGKDQLNPNTTAAEGGELDKYVWDSNAGFGADSGYNSSFQAWMWKRHAGFDVVAYKGNGNIAGDQIAHSLNAVPEMIWIKNRDETRNWPVYHKGLNGGTDPADHYIYLNGDGAESNDAGFWNDTMPTSTHFTLGTYGEVSNAQNYIALLFASVDGISKVGSYTGNGTGASSTQTITLGFQPRFLIVKKASGTNHWAVFDTTRGWGSGTNDAVLELNETGAQSTSFGDVTEPTSTGFVIRNNYGMINTNNANYIYYAHA